MDWYDTDKGQEFLALTDGGKFAVVYRATFSDGRILVQFDPETFERAIHDQDFSLVDSHSLGRIPIDSGHPKAAIVNLEMLPTALSRRFAVLPVISVLLKPELGEKLVARWLVDHRAQDGRRICRQMVGIERDGVKTLVVVSPSGRVTVCSDTDRSFEGE